MTLAESGSIDAVTAGEHKSLFETWQTGVAYGGAATQLGGQAVQMRTGAHLTGWMGTGQGGVALVGGI